MYAQKRSTFNRKFKDGQLVTPAGRVEVTHVPTGAACTVELLEDTAILRNGRMTLINNELSDVLHMCGAQGDIIIHHTQINYGVPKWLTYKIHNEPFNEWKDEIVVYLTEPPKHPQYMAENPYGVKVMVLEKRQLKVEELTDAIVDKSKSIYYDGMIVSCKNIQGEVAKFHFLPQRYAQGRVVDIGEDWVIAEVKRSEDDQPHIVRVPSLSNAVKTYIDKNEKDNIIGRMLKVQYTSYIPGDRVENFSSPVALFIINQ